MNAPAEANNEKYVINNSRNLLDAYEAQGSKMLFEERIHHVTSIFILCMLMPHTISKSTRFRETVEFKILQVIVDYLETGSVHYKACLQRVMLYLLSLKKRSDYIPLSDEKESQINACFTKYIEKLSRDPEKNDTMIRVYAGTGKMSTAVAAPALENQMAPEEELDEDLKWAHLTIELIMLSPEIASKSAKHRLNALRCIELLVKNISRVVRHCKKGEYLNMTMFVPYLLNLSKRSDYVSLPDEEETAWRNRLAEYFEIINANLV